MALDDRFAADAQFSFKFSVWYEFVHLVVIAECEITPEWKEAVNPLPAGQNAGPTNTTPGAGR